MIARLAAGRRPQRVATTLAIAIGLAGVLPASLFPHAVVFPRSSATGAYERYVLRVPNEKNVATTRIEIRFSPAVRVTSFADVPGWRLDVLVDSAKRIVGAAWTGTLPPQRFVELPFVAVNPRSSARVAWPAYQTYADGQRVEWTGEEGSKAPASVTSIAPAETSHAGAPAAWAAYAALALALISLGLVLRRGEERATGSR